MAEWSSFHQPIASVVSQAKPVRSHGAYVARHTQDGQLLAVAINQTCSHLNRMLYYSAHSDTLVVADMRGSGAKRPSTESYR